MQTESAEIWTGFVESLFYNNNYYTIKLKIDFRIEFSYLSIYLSINLSKVKSDLRLIFKIYKQYM